MATCLHKHFALAPCRDNEGFASEFILEALYVNNRLSKYAYRGAAFYKQ